MSCRSSSGINYKTSCILKIFIHVRLFILRSAICSGRNIYDLRYFVIVYRCLIVITQKCNNIRYFLIRHEGTLQTYRLRVTGREKQHITLSQKLFCTALVQNCSGINGRGYRECNTGRNIRLDHTGNDIHRWSLGCQDQMNAGCSGKLCQTAYRILHFLGGNHHQICKLIHDDHKQRHMGITGRFCILNRLDLLIIPGNIPDAQLFKLVVTVHHFPNCPVQGSCRFLRICHNRTVQMWNTIVAAKLYHLRIDHDQLHFIGI